VAPARAPAPANARSANAPPARRESEEFRELNKRCEAEEEASAGPRLKSQEGAVPGRRAAVAGEEDAPARAVSFRWHPTLPGSLGNTFGDLLPSPTRRCWVPTLGLAHGGDSGQWIGEILSTPCK